jgi:hypothetical protein
MEIINYHKYLLVRQADDEEMINLPGYPVYPNGEDIYIQGKEEEEIDPEQVSNIKEDDDAGKNNEKDFEEDLSGEDLDVPGSELDDNQEDIGSEDEENNYYSLGGEDHED